MRSNEVVGGSGQEEPSFESLCVGPGMPGPTGEGWKPGPEGGIEPLDERSVDGAPLALCFLDEVKGLEQITEGQSALYPLSVRPLDDLNDVQLGPLDQPRASWAPAQKGTPEALQDLPLPGGEPICSPEDGRLETCSTVNVLYHLGDHCFCSSGGDASPDQQP